MKNKIVGILLAAGQSSRFGSNKLLYPVVDNTPMLLVSAQKLVSAVPDSVTVISKELVDFAAPLEAMGMQVVINDHAEQGMGGSVVCGVRASDHAHGWVIMLADMPYIKTETIKLLADKLKSSTGIVAPVVNQQRGHPVGFAQHLKDELLALKGDTGARQVIKNHQHQLEQVRVDDIGTVTDIDQLSDIEPVE